MNHGQNFSASSLQNISCVGVHIHCPMHVSQHLRHSLQTWFEIVVEEFSDNSMRGYNNIKFPGKNYQKNVTTLMKNDTSEIGLHTNGGHVGITNVPSGVWLFLTALVLLQTFLLELGAAILMHHPAVNFIRFCSLWPQVSVLCLCIEDGFSLCYMLQQRKEKNEQPFCTWTHQCYSRCSTLPILRF